MCRCGSTSATASAPYVSSSRWQEDAAAQGVLLGADLLDDVHREQAAELGRALEVEVPVQRGQEAGPERVADTGRLDLADLGDGGDGDRLLALAVDADALGAQRDDPGAHAREHLVGGPAGLLGDQRGFVLVGEQDVRAVDEVADHLAVTERELLGGVGDEPVAALAALVGVPEHALRVVRTDQDVRRAPRRVSTIGLSSISRASLIAPA